MRKGGNDNMKSQVELLRPISSALWQPTIGQEVIIAGARTEGEKRFIGMKGKVVRNRGMGVFAIEFEDGRTFGFLSLLLRKVEVAQE